jgi:hypothetical protein
VRVLSILQNAIKAQTLIRVRWMRVLIFSGDMISTAAAHYLLPMTMTGKNTCWIHISRSLPLYESVSYSICFFLFYVAVVFIFLFIFLFVFI